MIELQRPADFPTLAATRNEPAAPEPAPAVNALFTYARTRTAFDIGLTNLLLNLITLGIFSFWARTRTRRFLWSTTRFRGDAFEYTGTGSELFWGAVKVLFIIFLPFLGLQYAAGLLVQNAGLPPILVDAPFGFAVLFLIGVGQYRAVRFRLSRTLWRGVGGTLTEAGWSYGLVYVLQYLALGATLGLSLPWMDTLLARRRYQTALLGDRPLTFTARGREIFGRWLLCWFLLIPSLGLSYAWYAARRERHFARSLRWGGLGFRFDVTGSELARFVAVNSAVSMAVVGLALAMAVAVVSAGTPIGWAELLQLPPERLFEAVAPGVVVVVLVSLAGFMLVQPFLALRWARLITRHLAIVGDDDLTTLGATAEGRERRGEGLASVFEADAF